ncbi:MAG TPA: M48 family metalloprotease [Gammaproteobacteria bacterium]|nr:M48 family metalloprotease [Gammaproteobacteria bacterium]
MSILQFHRLPRVILIVCLTCAIADCARNPVSGDLDFVTMSENQEIQTGAKYHEQILKQYGIYEAPALQNYISQLGKELAEHSHRKDLIYRFTVLDSPEVNAFALPGGYVYITRGILAYLNSEAEAGGVLGHEIGHVTARHGVKQQSAATAAQIFSAVVAMKTGSQTYSDLTNILGGALLSGYGRDQELEADRLGAEYIGNIGFDPHEMLRVIGVLKDQEEFAQQRAKTEGLQQQSYHGVFASHPENDQRLQEVVDSVKKQKSAEHTRDSDREPYLRQLDGLLFGQNPDQGLIRDNRFLHPDLGIAFNLPEEQAWRTQNLRDRFVMQRTDNQAMLQLTVEDLHKRETPKEYLYRVLDNPKPAREESLDINGLPAYTLTGTVQTNAGRANARFTVIFYGEKAYLFVGAVDPKADFATHDPQFVKIAGSFHRMTGQERQLAKPYRLKLYRTKPGDTYAGLARQMPMPAYKEEQLRLLNGDYPDHELKAGRLIKLVE